MNAENKKINTEKDIIKYFEKNILDNILMIKKRTDEKTGNVVIYPCIEITEILKMNLSEEQNNRILNYLTENGITISDQHNQMDKNIENYNYVCAFKQKVLPKQLTQKEITEKFALLKMTNDPIIREQLILNGLHRVPFVAQKFAKEYGLNQYEVESYGYEGIIKAVDKFDYTKGTDFFSYANKCIIREIIRGIPELEYLQNITFEMYNAIKNQEKELNLEQDKSKSMAEKITDYLIQSGHLSQKSKKKYLTKIELLLTTSLEELSENQEEIISNKNEINDIEKLQLKKALKDLIKQLPQKEQIVITEKYGLNDGIEKSYKEIEEILNLSEQRIKQLEAKALVKLRYKSKDEKIKSSIELENYGEDTLEEYHNTYKRR